MTDNSFSNRDRPIIFSTLDLETVYTRDTDDPFLHYFHSIYGSELNAMKQRLSKYKKSELQKAIDYIYDKIKKDRGSCSLELISTITYYEYYIHDAGKGLCNDLINLGIRIESADFFFALYWCGIEFLYKALKDSQDFIFEDGSPENLSAMAVLLDFAKHSAFSFTLGREEHLKYQTHHSIEDIKRHSNIMIDHSFIAGGNFKSKVEKSKGGKSRADKYKPAKEYVVSEYKKLLKTSPNISNNKAVHLIIEKMDKDNFDYSPLIEYSRIDTLRKWVAKIKKGEEP